MIPGSVGVVARPEVPGIGTLEYWYGETREGGWCAALRLPDGAWAGDGASPRDQGGAAPGCTPTRTQINGADPVYVINGFDVRETGLSAGELRRSPFWRVQYGVVQVPGARPVRVVDLASGNAAPVDRGGAFALALRSDPDVPGLIHLVAYDAAGRVVADDRTPLP